MYQKILIPVSLDHEKLVPRKLALARALLAEGGSITLLTVVENIPGFVAEMVTVKERSGLKQKILDRLRQAAGDDPAIDCDVASGKPGVEVARYAEAHGTGLIILGSHQPGVQDYFLGSTAARVARRAPCSVMIVR